MFFLSFSLLEFGQVTGHAMELSDCAESAGCTGGPHIIVGERKLAAATGASESGGFYACLNELFNG